MEKWENIVGFEHYQISNMGNVRGSRGMMKTRVNGRGYMMIGLRNKTDKQKIFLVHRLVAEHFIENPYNKKYVNHIDGDKHNNSVTNLEWVTQSENMIHAYKEGLQEITPAQIKRLSDYAAKKRRPVRVIHKGKNIDKTYESVKGAAEDLKINTKTLINTLKKHYNSRLGYEAYYLDGGD